MNTQPSKQRRNKTQPSKQGSNKQPQIPSIGQRYRLRRTVDRAPYFLAQPGLVGRIIHCDEHLIRLQMVEYLGDLAQEFQNCIEWYNYEPTFPLLEVFFEDCELLTN